MTTPASKPSGDRDQGPDGLTRRLQQCGPWLQKHWGWIVLLLPVLCIVGILILAVKDFFGGSVPWGRYFQLSQPRATVMGSIGVIIAAVITMWWNLRGQKQSERVAAEDREESSKQAARALEAAEGRAREENDQATVRGLRDRYTTAVEQLGSGQAAIRLGGATALAGLADDWLRRRQSDEAQVCIDVLCSYLRMPAPPDPNPPEDPWKASNRSLARTGRELLSGPRWAQPEKEDEAPQPTIAAEEQEVRRSILEAIHLHTQCENNIDETKNHQPWRNCSSEWDYDARVEDGSQLHQKCSDVAWCDLRFDLSRAILPALDWSRSAFRKEVKLTNVSFTSRTDFRGIRFGGGVTCHDACFSGETKAEDLWVTKNCDFNETVFKEGAYFKDARFHCCAEFKSTFEKYADFRGAWFDGAAWFAETEFYGPAIFGGSRFLGTFFGGAHFLGETSFARAVFYDSLYESFFHSALFNSEADFKNVEWGVQILSEDEKWRRKGSCNAVPKRSEWAHWGKGVKPTSDDNLLQSPFHEAQFTQGVPEAILRFWPEQQPPR